jgi:GPH family glycoside/pentoside/hexuronide:cation symporter
MKQTFWAVRGNKPLLIVVGVIGTYLFSIMATANLAYFVNVYYIYEGDVVKGAQLGGWDGSIRFFFALGAAALIHRLTGRIDKHRIMTFSVYILIIAFVGTYFTIQPGRPWLSLVMKPLIAVGECGFWVLILSMRADVCDWDEYLHRSRNEGVIAAVTNWCNKIAITLAIAVSGFILQHVIQFDSSLSEAEMVLVTEKAERDFNSIPSERISDDGKRPESLEKLVERYKRKEIMDSLPEGTLERLRFFYSIPQVIALLICVVLLRHYPLNHEKMSTIRSELESRRGS